MPAEHWTRFAPDNYLLSRTTVHGRCAIEFQAEAGLHNSRTVGLAFPRDDQVSR
jgi:hypothetical protein